MSDQKTWKILFRGGLIEGYDLAAVKQECASRFKLPAEKLEKFFSGKEIVLKKGLDRAQLLKAVASLKQMGLIVHFVAETVSPDALSLTPIEEAPKPDTLLSVEDSHATGGLSLEPSSPKKARPEAEESKIDPSFPATLPHTSVNTSSDDGANEQKPLSSMSMAEKAELYADRDRPVERPAYFGFDLDGRMGRMSFIIASSVVCILMWWLSFASVLFSATLIMVFPCYFAFIRLQVFRLNDMGLPAYLVAIPPVLNLLIAFIIANSSGFGGATVLHFLVLSLAHSVVLWKSISLITLLINGAIFLFLCAKPGIPGENDFGSPVVDGLDHPDSGKSTVSPAIVGGAVVLVIGLLLVLFTPSFMRSSVPLTVVQLNQQKSSLPSGEFVQLEAYAAWSSANCVCEMDDSECLPCINDPTKNTVMIFSDTKGSAKKHPGLNLQKYYELVSNKNSQNNQDFIVFYDPPGSIEVGKKYQLTFYTANGLFANFALSSEMKFVSD